MPSSQPTDNWFKFYRRNPRPLMRLFCFPHAGGGTATYHPWPRHLPGQIEVCAVQLPGRESRIGETPFTRLAPLVQALAAALAPHLDLPFAFFGHSMGALIGFELSRELRRLNRPSPAHLLVASFRAPHLPDPDPPIAHLPRPELIEELRRIEGTPEELLQHPELMELFLPLLRADFSVCETYAYAAGEPLDCPITAFGGLQDSVLGEEELRRWGEHTRDSFDLHMLPGNHFFLHGTSEPFMSALGRELTRTLTRIA